MIHPRLATMLVVITTDYPLAEGEAEAFLRPAVAKSFNRISVDGDCSTNDAVVLLANGASGASATTRRSRPRSTRCAATLPDRSSRTVRARRSCSRSASTGLPRRRRPRRSRAGSRPRRSSRRPRSVTIPTGASADGRGLGAVGGGFARLDTERLTVAFDGVAVFAAGSPTGSVPELAGPVCRIDLELGLGDG